MAPPNTTIGTALPIAVPSTTVMDVSGISPAYTVWFSYTAQAGDVIISILAYPVSGSNYLPQVTVWIGPTGSPTLWPYDITSKVTWAGNPYIATDEPFQFPVTPGTTYYIEVVPGAGSTVTAPNLVLVASQQPSASPLLGDLIITDDQHLFPAAILSQSDGTIRHFVPLVNGEAGDIVRSAGIYAFSNDDTVTEVGGTPTMTLYDRNFTLVTTVTVASAESYSLRASATNFFYSVWNNPTGVVSKMSVAGVVSGTTWSITGASIIAPSRDESILYYSNGNAGSAIKRWDLVNNVGLSDLVAAPGAGYSLLNTDGTILVLGDGSIVVMWAVGGTHNFSVRQYDPSGTLMQTYAFNLPADSQAGGRVCPTTDDPASFWAWSTYFATASPNNPTSLFTRFKTSDGSTQTTFTRPVFEAGAGPIGTGNQAIPPLPSFGNSWSCPLVPVMVAPSPVVTTTTYPVRRLRQTAHLSDEQVRLFFSKFQLDCQSGVGLTAGQGADPQVMLSWSDDGGHTWSAESWMSAGHQGEYKRRVIWRRLGSSRDRVWRIVVSDPVAWRLLTAYIDVEKGTS